MKVSKIGILAVSSAMVLSLGAFAGCSSNSASSAASSSAASSSSAAAQAELTDEDEVEAAVEASLDPYKNADPEIIAEQEDNLAALGGDVEQLGISTEDFIKAFLTDFDYEVTGVTVDGDQAEATVNITMKSLTDYTEKSTELVTDITSNPEQFAGMSQEDVAKQVGEQMTEIISGLDTETTEDVALAYEKVDGEWVPTEETSELLDAMIFG